MERERREVRHESGLVWYPDLGYGKFPADWTAQYGQAYFDNYVGYKCHAVAEPLMRARADLVNKHCGGAEVVDIGIGSGHFIEVRGGATCGYDVNPVAIRWLLDRNAWFDPFAKSPDHVTCWDSLEHMERPDLFVERVKKTVFVSVPVFADMEDVLRSKHFKPKEHIWYWSPEGFVRWMEALGFSCVEQNSMECSLGREAIGTFVFCRSN